MSKIVPELAVIKYLDRIEVRQSPNTVSNKKTSIYGFVDWLDIPLWSVSKTDIENYIDFMLRSDYALRSVKNKCHDVSSFYDFCIEQSLINNNPVKDVDLTWLDGNKIDEYTQNRYIKKEEYKKMISVEMSPRDKILIRLLWSTGVRASEAVSIQIDDFDFENKSVSILNSKSSDNSRRKVYFGQLFAKHSKQWLNNHRKAHIGAGQSPYFLVSKHQDAMHSNRVNDVVRDRARDAGIQKGVYVDQSGATRHRVTAHTLRHSYAVLRVQNGMNLKFLSELMGHSSVEVTAEQYLVFKDEDIQKADQTYRP